jgi:predicted nucleotide-binding protein
MATANSKKVFVVYGRNKHVKKEMFAFLKMLSLSPVSWEEAVLATSKKAPYIGETVDGLFHQAQAVVVLLTGDDVAQLRGELSINTDLEVYQPLLPQPRANVLFETGMAFSHSWLAPHTILVEVGNVRICYNLEGRHRIKLTNKMEDRWALVRSLESAGCAIEIPSLKLLRDIGDFSLD